METGIHTGRQWGAPPAYGGTTCWYPSSGLREWNSGMLFVIESHGWGWSVSSHGEMAYSFGFNLAGVSNRNYDNRSRGFPVRCIRE